MSTNPHSLHFIVCIMKLSFSIWDAFTFINSFHTTLYSFKLQNSKPPPATKVCNIPASWIPLLFHHLSHRLNTLQHLYKCLAASLNSLDCSVHAQTTALQYPLQEKHSDHLLPLCFTRIFSVFHYFQHILHSFCSTLLDIY